MRKQIDVINELKDFWGVKEFSFEAQYAVNRKGNGFFRNLRKTSDKSKILLPNGSQLTVGVSKELKLEEDRNYLISVFVPNDEVRSKFENEYTILLDTRKSPPKAIESQPESYVKSLEREYRSVVGIGLDSLKGAIKRISYDINRKPETFIFELLQNADDYPDKLKERVVVSFKIVNEYLVFQHNGLPFATNNVRALCSVDAGDKEYDFEKIGYKGIGFKSIFKHSNYVLIHSGGYTFKFDENYHRSQGIDTFWQLIPIWTDLLELPESVQNQIGNNFSVTVIIKPEEGNSQLRSYEETFNTIFKDERVLLFLRHVEHFSFRGTTTTIVKRKDTNTWAISKLEPVVVPDEIKRIINDKIKVDDRIPQKYEDIEKTNLTFATQKIEGKIMPTEQAHLYAYLPTDLDFGFPFLLNGDFIPDGGRHYLHADLEWNQFLFKEAGKNLLKWIAALWLENSDIGAYHMLPDEKKLVSERPGDEKEVLLKCFLNGLMEEKNKVKFIATDTNELCCVSDIILDDTGLFSKGILPYSLYYNISNATKKLPHPHLSMDRLFSSYLEIERFTSKQLIDLLYIEENREKFKLAIKTTGTFNYFGFLSWFNTFCYVNNVPNIWLLSIPVVSTKYDIYGLSEVLSNGHFIFKTQRTKNVEGILSKMGFDLSNIYIDDHNYQYLYGILLQQDSYLKSDVRLYEHIAAAKDLNKLNESEKNILITFFDSLVDVGPAKYAKLLSLFKSQKQDIKLKSLNSLISNTCVDLPLWLKDFVINAEEEKALSPSFQAHLLKEKDLFGKLFCNLDSYNEIIANINSENIDEFYTYLLILYKAKPDDANIDFSFIPLVFIESSSTFTLPSTVYWPESITKLSALKYASVKLIFETFTDEKLPHQSALQIKAPFALGSKDLKLTEIIPKQNSFDVISLNDFLDWAENNGEKDLLNHFSFSKIDEKFSIGKVNGTSTYFTTDETLIEFIESSEINTKLRQLPKELYTRERNKIALLEGVTLLKNLIENGFSTPELAKYIQTANDSQLSLQYLELLTELNIVSSKSYTIEDAEFIILKLSSNLIIDDISKLDSFRDKIILDGVKLLEKAVSADVMMFDAESKFIYQFQNIELCDVLPAYTGKTYSVSEIVELFINFRDAEGLRKIFKAKGRGAKKIYSELLELNLETYNAAQTLFLSYYQSLYPQEAVLKGKLFLAADPETNRDTFEKEVGKFFDYCVMEDNFTIFVEQGIIDSFNPTSLITDDNYATESERLPYWLKTWLNTKNDEKKKLFIEKIKINGENSHVVQLRKGLRGDTAVNMDAARGGIVEPELLKNTFVWLIETHPNIVYNSTTIKSLYERANVLNIPISEIPLPLPLDIEGNYYSIKKPAEDAECHLLWNGWGNFKKEIWEFLKNMNCLILDNILPERYLEKINPLKSEVEININSVELKKGLRDFNAWFYKHWEGKKDCIIKIYRGDKLPQVVIYNNLTIKTFNDGLSAKINGEYIVAESIETSIPHSIKDLIPEFFHELNSWKSDFENNRTERKLTPQEEEAIMKLFDGVVPEEFRKNLNLAALASALVYLESDGYDVSQANKELINTHEYAQLAPVFKEGLQHTVMCRSARLGLLYLTKQAWDRLDNPIDPNIMLFADKGYGESDLFRTKQDILNVNKDNPTDFQLIRIESRANAIELDEMLQGKFEDASRLWIIFRLKDNEHFDKLFFDRYETNNNPLNTVNIRTDDIGGY
jgi:hypothetical protein